MDQFSYPDNEFMSKKHAQYFERCLQTLPPSLASFEMNKLTIAFFAISGLDLLNSLDIINSDKSEIINWIYSLQILPTKNPQRKGQNGFRGSFCNGIDNEYDCGNLAMTYCALLSLIILGDDLKRIDKTSITQGLSDYQLQDGSFVNVAYEKDNDMRFVYCASAICYILNDWSGIDVEKIIDFIKQSLTYENAFGQKPGLEAHGGSTYCAVASLYLMNQLNKVLTDGQVSRLKRWCLFKQEDGFQGRPNKDCDSCYSFWVGATLKLLNSYDFVNFKLNKQFILSTQEHVIGGLAKYPGVSSDPLHSYLSLSGLALSSHSELPILPVDPSLNISQRAMQHLKQIQINWIDKTDSLI